MPFRKIEDEIEACALIKLIIEKFEKYVMMKI